MLRKYALTKVIDCRDLFSYPDIIGLNDQLIQRIHSAFLEMIREQMKECLQCFEDIDTIEYKNTMQLTKDCMELEQLSNNHFLNLSKLYAEKFILDVVDNITIDIINKRINELTVIVSDLEQTRNHVFSLIPKGRANCAQMTASCLNEAIKLILKKPSDEYFEQELLAKMQNKANSLFHGNQKIIIPIVKKLLKDLAM